MDCQLQINVIDGYIWLIFIYGSFYSTCTYIYIYVHVYIHTYIYIYTYIYNRYKPPPSDWNSIPILIEYHDWDATASLKVPKVGG